MLLETGSCAHPDCAQVDAVLSVSACNNFIVVTARLAAFSGCSIVAFMSCQCTSRCWTSSLLTYACLLCRRRENLSDALEKMQACLDRAAESLIPPEVDEAKMKQIAKQCAPL